jgi:hypothetical protein
VVSWGGSPRLVLHDRYTTGRYGATDEEFIGQPTMPDEQDEIKPQAPYVLSMIICDSVYVEAGTGKQAIIGCFGSIGSPIFPALHPSMMLFAELSDGRGDVPLTIRLVDVDDEKELFSAKAVIPNSDPLAVSVLAVEIRGVVFPSPGEYRFQLISRDDLLMERRLLLIQRSGAQGDEPKTTDD